ncbi:MAG: uridine kinase [Clostridia bacterium]
MDRIVIGVAGGTGSGKTTIAKKLIEAFGVSAVILSHDFYYKENAGMSFEERSKQNYDHPNSLDTNLMIEHIRKLKNGETILHPTYNFSTHSRNAKWSKMKSAQIIIVEGILIFESLELCSLCDVKLFVDTDADVRFIRRLKRDINTRGRSVDSVVNQYLSTVKPMHEQFVEPSKRNADIIVPEGGHNVVAIDMIINAIRQKINLQ